MTNYRRSMFLTALFSALMLWSMSARAGFIENGVPICTVAGTQESIRVSACPDGGAIIVWVDSRSYACLYAQRIDAEGRAQWAADGIRICAFLSNQTAPSMTADGAGGAFIVWEDSRTVTTHVYAQHIDATGAQLWAANGVAASLGGNAQTSPRVCVDDAGGCIIAWQSGSCDIGAQRISEGGARLWTDTGVIVYDTSYCSSGLCLCRDGAGGALVGWVDSRGYAGLPDIYAQRVRGSGALAWESGGVAVCTADYAQTGLRMQYDGRCGAILAWVDSRWGGFDTYGIFCQSIDSLGAGRWTANGVSLITDPMCLQQYPSIAADGSGGAVIAYLDWCMGTHYCYAKRVTAAGVRPWSSWGVSVCGQEGESSPPSAVTDGRKGAIVVWSDNRNGNLDLYAQRVDSLGALAWTSGGIPLVQAANNQHSYSVCSNGTGGAIAAWRDFRIDTQGADVYAGAVGFSGGPIATFLESSDVRADGSGITLVWTLSAMDNGVTFEVGRATGGAGDFVCLDGAIEANGRSFVYRDGDCEPGAAYRYRVMAQTGESRFVLFETGVVEIPAAALLLSQNAPNPFNPATAVEYYLPWRCAVRLVIHDAAGRTVAILADEVQEAGPHSVVWKGTDNAGRNVASGVYFCVLRAGKESLTRKMVLLR